MKTLELGFGKVIPILALCFITSCGRTDEGPGDKGPVKQPVVEEKKADEAGAQKHIEEGLEHFAACRDRAARESFDKAVQADPDNGYALAMRGVAGAAHAYFGFRPDEKRPGKARVNAIPYWRQSRDPEENWGTQLEAVRKAMKEGLRDVENAVDKDRVDERLWLCRGVVYLWRSDVEGEANLDKAVENFDQAIVLNSRLVDAYYYRLWIRLKRIPYLDWRKLQAVVFILDFPTKRLREPSFRKTVSLMQMNYEDRKRIDSLRKDGAQYILRRNGREDLSEEQVDTALLMEFPWPADGDQFIWKKGGSPEEWYRHKMNLLKEHAYTEQEIFEGARDGVVLIRTDRGTGTGFCIGPHGFIMTNAHVVEGTRTIEIVFRDGRKTTATVARRNSRRDLALLKVPEGTKRKGVTEGLHVDCVHSSTILVSAGKLPPVGTKLVAIGHPEGLNWSTTSGLVSAHRTENGVRLIQTDTALTHGSSGGPVFDEQGRIVGIVKSGLEGEDFNFVIWIAEWLGIW